MLTPKRYQEIIKKISLGSIYDMLKRLRNLRENAKSEIKKAKLCRTELLIGFLVCYLFRSSTIKKLRASGHQPSFRYVNEDNGGGEWLLVLYPEDHKTGKGSKMFELMDILQNAHEKWMNKYCAILMNGKTHDSYFVRDNGEPFNNGDIYDHTIRVTLRMLGVAINPHLFRHLMATKWIEKDERNLIAVSKLLLHKSIDFTARKYLKYDERKASNKINGEWNSMK